MAVHAPPQGPAGGGTLVCRLRRAAAAWALAVAALAAAALVLAACGAPTGGAAAAHRRPLRDPETRPALLRIARRFNDDYATNRDAAVYDRWDAASRAVISRAAFLRRHRDCPDPPEGRVDTWGVTRGPGGAWLVHYSIGGIQFVDYWYYAHGSFVFDLPRSNPGAVALYRSTPAQYAKAVGCGG